MPDKIEIVNESFGCLYQGYDGLDEARKVFSESKTEAVTAVKGGAIPKNCLKVTLPVGYVDKETANGNLYESVEMERALEDCKSMMLQGLVQGATGEHPKDRADLRPDEISHLVTKAWVDPSTKLLWNEWLIIPTVKGGGKDLQELFLAGASIGTSIRGTAVRESGKYMRHYTFKGTDTVAIPSTGIRPGINNENLRARIEAESFSNFRSVVEGVMEMKDGKEGLAEELKSISESLKNVTEGKAAASDLLQIGSKLGVLESRITSLQTSGDSKDAEITELRKKLDEFKTVKEALETEKSTAVQESVSFKKVIDELKAQVDRTESEVGKKDQSLDVAIGALEDLRDRFLKTQKEGGNFDKSVAVIEDLRQYALKCEGVIGECKEYILGLESVIVQLRDRTNASEAKFETFMKESDESEVKHETLFRVIGELRDRLKGVEVTKPRSATMESYVNFVVSKNPQLRIFREELLEVSSVAAVNARCRKYLDMVDKSHSFVSESMGSGDKAVRGIEKHLQGMR